MVCQLQQACACLGPSVGRSWCWSRCLWQNLRLRGEALSWRPSLSGRLLVWKNLRARGRVFHGKPFAPRAQPQRRNSCLLRNHLHHPASLPCNRLYSPGPFFCSVCSISTLTPDSCAVKGETKVNSPTLDRCPHTHRLHLDTQRT